MVEVDSPTEVQEFFLAEPLGDLTPILTLTKMQIVKFTDTVATALTQCSSKLGHLREQTYLVLTETEYRMRLNDLHKNIPIRPNEPKPYDNSTHTQKS